MAFDRRLENVCHVSAESCVPLLLLKVSFTSILFISAPFPAVRMAIPLSAISHPQFKKPHMPEEDNGYLSRTNR